MPNVYDPGDTLDPLTGLPKKKAAPGSSGIGSLFGADPSAGSPPPGTSPAGLPSTTRVPGFMPDYASLIASDPLLGQTKADYAASNVSDLASRNSLINRALVQFGTVPDVGTAASSLGFNLGDVVDPATRQLATDNPYSTQATLSDALHKQISQIRRALAARGGLQSGELGYQLGEANKGYGQAQNDATQKLLDTLGGYHSQYAAGVKAAQEALQRAQQEAAARQAALNPPTGSSTATLAGIGPDGSPVYEKDGVYYDISGSRTSNVPVSQASAPTPAPLPDSPQDESPWSAPVPAVGASYDPTVIPQHLTGTFGDEELLRSLPMWRDSYAAPAAGQTPPTPTVRKSILDAIKRAGGF